LHLSKLEAVGRKGGYCVREALLIETISALLAVLVEVADEVKGGFAVRKRALQDRLEFY